MEAICDCHAGSKPARSTKKSMKIQYLGFLPIILLTTIPFAWIIAKFMVGRVEGEYIYWDERKRKKAAVVIEILFLVGIAGIVWATNP